MIESGKFYLTKHGIGLCIKASQELPVTDLELFYHPKLSGGVDGSSFIRHNTNPRGMAANLIHECLIGHLFWIDASEDRYAEVAQPEDFWSET